jgi:hypothetical protein
LPLASHRTSHFRGGKRQITGTARLIGTEGTKQPARKDSKRNKHNNGNKGGGKAPPFCLARQLTGTAGHNRGGARQITGGKAAPNRLDALRNRAGHQLAGNSEAKQDKSAASRTDAGGKARNQIAASKQVLGRRRQQEAAKAGKETAAFAVSNWVSGY